MTGGAPILEPGRNCERVADTQRVAWLIDGERYFGALASAIERAQRSVLLLGWDFHSRVRLRRGEREEEFVELLERVVRRRRRLHVRLLGWDFAMIYALEREFLPLARFQRGTHRRIHFRLDARHPLGASHHQKIAVIDDSIAFCGGLDVTACRWDTPEHLATDERRSDPGFPSYGPFHDVQMLVDGGAARALGAIARERWRRATGRRLRERDAEGDPWPPEVEPDLCSAGVAIARTEPASDGPSGLRHVETLYLDAIHRARRSIYLENQYFTCSVVAEALAQRLTEPDAPEVVVVLPRSLSGWLEERTMGALMAREVARLRDADRSGRLRVVCPVLPGDAKLSVHSKVMIVDDRFARVGSANLSNRSMGLDTECDLAVEVPEGSEAAPAIASFRSALLAEHLGVNPDVVSTAAREQGSLVRAVDALSGGERRLVPYDVAIDDFDEGILRGRSIFDPERPVPFEVLRNQLVGIAQEVEPASRGRGGLAHIAATAAIPLALLAAWQLTPLAELVSAESLSAVAETLDRGVAGRLLALTVFVVAALLLVPVTSLIVAAALVFGFTEGALLALLGSVVAAAAGHMLGRTFWRDSVRKVAGARLMRLNEGLARRGVLATAVLRMVPVAPFAVVNLVAGASRVRLGDFVLGTALGMAPGTAALAFFGERAAEVLRDPSPRAAAAAAAGALAVVALAWTAQRLFPRSQS